MVIKLMTEAVEVTLDDQGSPWESKNSQSMMICNKNENRRKNNWPSKKL